MAFCNLFEIKRYSFLQIVHCLTYGLALTGYIYLRAIGHI